MAAPFTRSSALKSAIISPRPEYGRRVNCFAQHRMRTRRQRVEQTEQRLRAADIASENHDARSLELPSRLKLATAEATEVTELFRKRNLCGLGVLCGGEFCNALLQVEGTSVDIGRILHHLGWPSCSRLTQAEGPCRASVHREQSSQPLAGQLVVFTGKLSTLGRATRVRSSSATAGASRRRSERPDDDAGHRR